MRVQVEDIKNWSGGLNYCRTLKRQKIDTNQPLEVYRGEMLCYTIRSIEEGSTFRMSDITIKRYNEPRQQAHGFV